MNRINAAGYDSNTLFIFTSDHATYTDDDFVNTFYPDYERITAFCDRIPFVIWWYDSITSAAIDAEGRNSLDLTPTILDYLDIDAPNFFLGASFFLPVKICC